MRVSTYSQSAWSGAGQYSLIYHRQLAPYLSPTLCSRKPCPSQWLFLPVEHQFNPRSDSEGAAKLGIRLVGLVQIAASSLLGSSEAKVDLGVSNGQWDLCHRLALWDSVNL